MPIKWAIWEDFKDNNGKWTQEDMIFTNKEELNLILKEIWNGMDLMMKSSLDALSSI